MIRPYIQFGRDRPATRDEEVAVRDMKVWERSTLLHPGTGIVPDQGLGPL